MPTNTKRKTKNKVLHPLPESISGKLWAIADAVKSDLGRNPARFEYREAVAKSGSQFNHESISYQWFRWRRFHGIKGHSSKRYPSRNTFEASTQTAERLAPKKKKK